MRFLSGSAFVLLVACTSCDGLFTSSCAGVGRPNVVVTVVDSLTDAPAAAGATLLTYDLDHGGTRVDSITGQADTDSLVDMSELAGHFSVFVRKAGYRDWSAPDVTVRNGCPAIHTVFLTARLARP